MTSRTGVEPPDYRRIFEAAPRLFLVLRPNPPAFTIEAVSDAYLAATMTRREQVVGRSLFEIFPDNPEDPDATGTANLRASLERVCHHGAADAMAVQKYDIARPDGTFEVRHWSPRNSPVFDEQGRLRHLIHEVEDVTDFVEASHATDRLRTRAGEMEREIIRRAQEIQDVNRQLRATNEQLGRLDELKTQFFSNVSHELRTPLALILGSIDRMREHPVASALRPDLETISRSARILLKHVNDLLDIVKLDADRMQVAYARVDLARLLRLLTSYFLSLGAERDIRVDVDAPPRLVAEVDPEKLERVILNLLSNAFKFTPDGGRVTVRLAIDPGGDRVSIEVRDSGPGVPESEWEAIFERFHQVDGGSDRHFGGTGLGLSIAKDLLSLHGGTIAVGDAPEGGARFVAELPLRAPVGASVAEPGLEMGPEPDAAEPLLDELRSRDPASGIARERSAAGTATILVVEDHPDMRRFIASTLAKEHRVLTAGTGEEALTMAAASPPDLIVTDVMMPGMTGEALVRELRAKSALDDVPILVLSAASDERLRVRLLENGAQDFVAKPFSAEELRTRVRNALALRRENERLLHVVTDSLPVLVSYIDRDQRYRFVNRTYETWFGRACSEIRGQTVETVVGPETYRMIREHILAVLAGRETTFTARFPYQGVFRDVEALYVPHRDATGDVVGYAALVTDITARRVDERLREEFLAMLAHELRNPLASITNAAALLQKVESSPRTARPREVLNRQVRHMARLVDDLLDVSRIARGKIEIRREPLDLTTLLRDVVSDREVEAEQRGISLHASFPARLVPVEGDPTRLAQVFSNVIGNSLKFTPRGGTIRVDLENGGPLARVRIADTGAGIEPALLETIYQPFTQGDRSLDRTGGGLGLGLAVAKGLVELHGGRISTTSEGPGKGTTVEVVLPTTEAACRTEPAFQASDTPSLRILLFEDHADIAESLCELLEDDGHIVRARPSGVDAVEQVAHFRPDVVVCDIGLPEKDGFTIAAEIREAFGADAPRLIALSGYAVGEDRRRSSRAGFDLHLVKPIDPGVLSQILAEGASKPQ